MRREAADPAQSAQARWEELRDQAEVSSEGPREIAFGTARAEYEIAQIPAGFVWRAEYSYARVGGATPWSWPDWERDTALERARQWLTERFSSQIAMLEQCHDAYGRGSLPDCRRALERLEQRGLFGFEEPEVTARESSRG